MNYINFSCQGESHIATGKVCQDYSYSHIYENGTGFAIVCDGHGGRRYFRSDIGAKIAAKAAEIKVNGFIEEAGELLLKGTPFVQRGTVSDQIAKEDFAKSSETERAFRWLFGSIISEWNAVVASHAECNPLTESEKTGLEDRWIKDFEEGINLEKVYGCTLMLCVYTPGYWFAFQIGDGKCFACDDKGNWTEPIPWDENCFLNKTTSICDSNAINEFRYCYEGDGKFPIAIILGSDGIDDSFGSEENQANFYVQILKSLAKEGIDATEKEIKTTLPQLSKIGSRDDMSISMIFDMDKVSEAFPNLVQWQIENTKRHIAEENAKIEEANRIREHLESTDNPSDRDRIELKYALADENRAIERRAKLLAQLDSLMKEITNN